MIRNKEYHRNYYHLHSEKMKASITAYNRSPIGKEKKRERLKKLKIKVIQHYSNGTMVCAKCSFSDIRALSIDHIHGGGTQHHKELHGLLYTWLIKNMYPKGYQVLCMNCQFIKRYTDGELLRRNKNLS